ncbi:MAG: GTP cyclohydrolase, partial [Flavobacterium sp.]
MITISPVKTNKDIQKFVQFSYDLYKNCKQWIPPLFQEELNNFNPKKNPVFENASANLFLAYKNNEIVGRVAVIINRNEIEQQGIEKVRFGWFDAIDNQEVFKKLLDTVIQIGRANNLKYLEGPMGFSNLDKVGALIDGYEQEGNMTTWYNYPYYIKHFKALGLVPEKTFVENKFQFSKVTTGTQFERGAKIVTEKYKVKLINFTKTKEILPYIDEMFQLFNSSYAQLSSFVAVSPKQIDFLKKKYIPMINPEYIKFVVDQNQK